jgi:hypothetical protein
MGVLPVDQDRLRLRDRVGKRPGAEKRRLFAVQLIPDSGVTGHFASDYVRPIGGFGLVFVVVFVFVGVFRGEILGKQQRPIRAAPG